MCFISMHYNWIIHHQLAQQHQLSLVYVCIYLIYGFCHLQNTCYCTTIAQPLLPLLLILFVFVNSITATPHNTTMNSKYSKCYTNTTIAIKTITTAFLFQLSSIRVTITTHYSLSLSDSVVLIN